MLQSSSEHYNIKVVPRNGNVEHEVLALYCSIIMLDWTSYLYLILLLIAQKIPQLAQMMLITLLVMTLLQKVMSTSGKSLVVLRQA